MEKGTINRLVMKDSMRWYPYANRMLKDRITRDLKGNLIQIYQHKVE